MANAVATTTFSESGVLPTILHMIIHGRRRGNPRLPPELWDLIHQEHQEHFGCFIRKLMVKFKSHEFRHRAIKSIECDVHFSRTFREPHLYALNSSLDRRKIPMDFPCVYFIQFTLGGKTFTVHSGDYPFRLVNNTLVADKRMVLMNDDDESLYGVFELQKCDPVSPFICRNGEVQLGNPSDNTEVNLFINNAYTLVSLNEDELQELEELEKRRALNSQS
jgi:hypothetical protein